MDSDWPLQIYDNTGEMHEIILAPGEMVWYESAKLIHGRVEKLNGSSFENLFVHFMPKSKAWFKSDIGMKGLVPDPPITLESIKEADKMMKEKKEQLRKTMEDYEQEMENLAFDERMKMMLKRTQQVIDDKQMRFEKIVDDQLGSKVRS